MRFAIIIFIISCVTILESSFITNPVFAKLKTKCLCKSDAPINLVNDLLTKGLLVDNNCLKCYLECLLTEAGLLDSIGNVDVAFVDSVSIPGLTKTILLSCNINVTTDICEKAYLITKCLLDSIRLPLG
ncbi:hypothetical protein FQR65_LT01249 [Abscondita terminalis]|nr:hypothetical protein FQR65_LT01249 [Abscondita terminalis]